MSNNGRPLSPHISIYRWPITMATSILHRAAGLAMSVGFLILVVGLFSGVTGEQGYETFRSYLDTTIGGLMLVGLSSAFFFHLCNGIRHLIWDSGRGLDKKAARASAWFVLVLTVALTALYWGIQA